MLHSKSIFSLVDFGTQVWKSCNLISQKIYYLLVPSISLIIVLIFFCMWTVTFTDSVVIPGFLQFPHGGPLYGSFFIDCTWHFINLASFLRYFFWQFSPCSLYSVLSFWNSYYLDIEPPELILKFSYFDCILSLSLYSFFLRILWFYLPTLFINIYTFWVLPFKYPKVVLFSNHFFFIDFS